MGLGDGLLDRVRAPPANRGCRAQGQLAAEKASQAASEVVSLCPWRELLLMAKQPVLHRATTRPQREHVVDLPAILTGPASEAARSDELRGDANQRARRW